MSLLTEDTKAEVKQTKVRRPSCGLRECLHGSPSLERKEKELKVLKGIPPKCRRYQGCLDER
jgi:hypothetical protein